MSEVRSRPRSSNVRNGRGAADAAVADTSPHFLFEYADEDVVRVELSEMFSYAEIAEFEAGSVLFETRCALTGAKPWLESTDDEKTERLACLLEELDFADPAARREAAICLLYLSQGTVEVESPDEQIKVASDVCLKLWRLGAFHVFVQQLTLSAKPASDELPYEHASVKANFDMRLFLNLLFFLVVLNKDTPGLTEELSMPVSERRPLSVLLFGLVSEFNDENGSNYPIKKILLLLWKCLLYGLGGTEKLTQLRREKRIELGLPPDPPKLPCSQENDIDCRFGGAKKNAIPIATRYQSSKWPTKYPPAIQEALDILEANAFVSLEEKVAKDSGLLIRKATDEIPPPGPDFVPRRIAAEDSSPFENLYRMLLHNLSRYGIILLKTVLAAMPTLKSYAGAISLVSELGPASAALTDVEAMEDPANFVAATDLKRHKEIIIKVISAILLLLLEHARINHVFQFEHISSILVDANCILLNLKFLNQDLVKHAENVNNLLDYELYGPDDESEDGYESAEDTPVYDSDADSDEHVERVPCSWRNVFATVNVLRILRLLSFNKARNIKTLVRYKTPAIMKRTLKLNVPCVSKECLELMRVVIPRLGRKWKMANVKIISRIYLELEPDMYGWWLLRNPPDANVPESKDWEIVLDDCMRRTVEEFVNRNYFYWRKYVTIERTSSCYSTTDDVVAFHSSKAFEDSLERPPDELLGRFLRVLDSHLGDMEQADTDGESDHAPPTFSGTDTFGRASAVRFIRAGAATS